MITQKKFEELLRQVESEKLDFKAKPYDLSDKKKIALFIKDIICMANTPRDEDSYIILGVHKKDDGSKELLGITEFKDESFYLTRFDKNIEPIPHFSYEIIEYEGKKFGVFKIPVPFNGPCIPKEDMGEILLRGKLYFRKGSVNTLATSHDIMHSIFSFFKNRISGSELKVLKPSIHEHPTSWNKFLQSVHEFNETRSYYLITSPLKANDNTMLSAIGYMPLCCVIDFDPNSDESGLLKYAEETLIEYRNVHIVVMSEKRIINPDKATKWYFARGIKGKYSTISTGSWREWCEKYTDDIKNQINEVFIKIKPKPVTCIVLCYDNDLIAHIDTTLTTIVSAMGNCVEFVIVTNDITNYQLMAKKYNANIYDIPLHQLCSGLQQIKAKTIKIAVEGLQLPSRSGAEFCLDIRTQRWLEEEITLIHMNIGTEPPKERNVGVDFLRGKQIDWWELNLHWDADRIKTEALKILLNKKLDTYSGPIIVNLFHEPGAGGTTVARRILWDYHRENPCAILNNFSQEETVNRLARIFSLTQLPILLLIDGAQIAERQIEELYNDLRAINVSVIMLLTIRRFEKQEENEDSFYLSSELLKTEARQLIEKLSNVDESKRTILNSLVLSEDSRQRTAFYFGLLVFGRKFLGIEPYVKARLDGLNPVQKKIMTYLSIAYRYAQRPISANAFADVLDILKTKTVNLGEVLPRRALELLSEEPKGSWRPAHYYLAIEMLEQLLCPEGGDQRIWIYELPDRARDFAKFCRSTGSEPGEEMLELVRRTFIYRGNSDMLGTERSFFLPFSELIESITEIAVRLDILKYLTQLFPHEAHFWAHLGRFYAKVMRDHKEAINCIDKAISLNPSDFVLHHINGMLIRYKIYSLIRENEDIKEIIYHVMQASIAFECARTCNPENEYAYISEIQMNAMVLSYASKGHFKGIIDYLSLPTTNSNLRDLLEKAENLLEQISFNRLRSKDFVYIKKCRAQLQALYKNYDESSVILDDLLRSKSAFRPPIRRQIVYNHRARGGTSRSWSDVEDWALSHSIKLLEENMDEEPENEINYRMWIQAIRFINDPPPLEKIIERVSRWKYKIYSLDSFFYLYILQLLVAFSGSKKRIDEIKMNIQECRTLARKRSIKTDTLEWLSKGNEIKQLIHSSQLGEWDYEKKFWKNPDYLVRLNGRIHRISGMQNGQIELENGLYAFYIPYYGGGDDRSRINRRVSFYLGFSYDGLRAWEVQDLD